MQDNKNNKQETIQLNNNEININNHANTDRNAYIPINNNNKNGNIRLDYYGQEILKNNKKHKISFIDQIHSKKNLAQVIYINDQVSLNDDKMNTNKYLANLDNLRKQSTNITDFSRQKKQTEIDTYKIKRPKSATKKEKRKIDKTKEQCGCIIF